jgi:endonuclease/exonuclease/phosphatase family metal-dependent hydrolase
MAGQSVFGEPQCVSSNLMNRLNKWIGGSVERLAWPLGLAVFMYLQACAHEPVVPEVNKPDSSMTAVNQCRNLLGGAVQNGPELDASRIGLFSWNVRKTRARGWRDDFVVNGDEADLVLFQEASLREETIGELDSSRHWSFAPGYVKRREITGVLTLSSIEPLARCNLVHVEPWLRSPKATGITEYGLTGTDQSLVVVNVHAVNLTFGTEAFEQQFEDIRRVLENHDGPIILSGDLNTWRGKRLQIVDDILASLDLVAIEFEDDNRVRFFGSALDHVYIRGLRTLAASTQVVDTSDHNPMSVILAL